MDYIEIMMILEHQGDIRRNIEFNNYIRSVRRAKRKALSRLIPVFLFPHHSSGCRNTNDA